MERHTPQRPKVMFAPRFGPTTIDVVDGRWGEVCTSTPLIQTEGGGTVFARRDPPKVGPGCSASDLLLPRPVLPLGVGRVAGLVVSTEIELEKAPAEWRLDVTVPTGHLTPPQCLTSMGTLSFKNREGVVTKKKDVIASVFYPVFVPMETKEVSVYVTDPNRGMDALQQHVKRMEEVAKSHLDAVFSTRIQDVIKAAASARDLAPLRAAFNAACSTRWETAIDDAMNVHLQDVAKGGKGLTGPAMEFRQCPDSKDVSINMYHPFVAEVDYRSAGSSVPPLLEKDVFDVLVTLGCRRRNASGGMATIHQTIWAILSTMPPMAYHTKAALVVAACELVSVFPDTVLGPGIKLGNIKGRGSGFIPYATYEALLGPLFRGYGPLAAAAWSQSTEPVMSNRKDSEQFCVWTKKTCRDGVVPMDAWYSGSVVNCHPSYRVSVDTRVRMRNLVRHEAAGVSGAGAGAGAGSSDDAPVLSSPIKRVRFKE